MVNQEIKDIRREYACSPLAIKSVLQCPIEQFERWFGEICKAPNELDKTAMVLSTIDQNGFPDARIVLLKEIFEKCFIFYTNYQSTKGLQLARNNKASLTFYWPSVCCQVRVKGLVNKIPEKQSDQYFKSRPRGSQVAAIISKQSKEIASREELEQRFLELESQHSEILERPKHWGGYALEPLEMEFWQGRKNRLHDRIKYIKSSKGSWITQRLQP